jgi:sugar diacid utilization regulator
VGARVFWHHVSAVAVDQQVDSRTLVALAEAVFVFVDRLSSSSARGFVLEQSEAAATRERLRDELVGLLLSDRADQAAVLAAASRAGWRVPDEVVVVLVQPDNPIGHRALARLDATHLVFSRPPLIGAILANPSRPGLRRRLAAALHGARAVVGVPVPSDRLPASLHVAEIAARLQETGVLDEDPVFTDEHLDAIIVHRDARLLEVLRSQVLAPLAGSTPASRERLGETLASWLRHMGDRQAIAAELHVHPQTVRYRLARLHELFGAELDDPAVRARLALALGWGAPRPAEPFPVGAPPAAVGGPGGGRAGR